MNTTETLWHIDRMSRCRHHAYRQSAMAYLVYDQPGHEITEQAKILHKQIRDDYPFRQAMRKVVMEFENRQVDNPQPGDEGDNHTAEVDTG